MDIRKAIEEMQKLMVKSKIVGLNKEEKDLQKKLARLIVDDPLLTCKQSCSVLDSMIFQLSLSILNE